MKRVYAALFKTNSASLLLKALRGSFLLLTLSIYFLSTSQASVMSPLAIATKVTVTHSHSHADDHDHEDDHHEDTEHDQSNSHDQQDHHDKSGTHSHTIFIVSSPVAYTSPAHGEFVGLVLSSPSFNVSRNVTAPLDPGLGSIFRPPIV